MIRLFGLIVALAIAACSAPAHPPKGRAIVAENAFVNDPIGGRDVTAGGLSITALGGDAKIIAASSPAAERVELHVNQVDDGVMRMRPVDAFELQNGEVFPISPGGPHLMFFGFDEAIDAGDTIELTLTLEWAGGETETVTSRAAVRSISD